MTSLLIYEEPKVLGRFLTSGKQNINANGNIGDEGIFSPEALIIENAKCFLCDCNFVEGQGTFLIFETRLRDDGGIDNPLAFILSTALGRDLDEKSAHSALLCEYCNKTVLEFEKLLQKFCEMRIRIITSYNRTIQGSNIDPILIDFEGEMTRENIPEVEEIFDNLIVDIRDTQIKRVNLIEPEIGSLGGCGNKGSVKNISAVLENAEFNPQHLVSGFVEEIIGNGTIVTECSTNDGLQCKDYVDNNSVNCKAIASTFCCAINDESSEDEHDMVENSQFEKFKTIFEQQDNLYVCLLCKEQKPMTADPFSEHMIQNHDFNFYSCEFCSAGFLSADSLNEHIENTHIKPKSGEYQCNICLQVFFNERLLHLHKRTHNSVTLQYECSECHKKYNCRNLLRDHMNMHNGQRPYKCSKCPKDFASKYTLQAHIKIHSQRLRPYKCDKCNKTFLNQQTLTHHKKLHLGEKTFICDTCSKPFGTQHNLDVHKIVHSGQRPFICRTCGKSFARRAEIKDHERIHTGEKPYKCDICDAAFAQRSNLMTHRKSTHLNEKLHKCDQCGRSFKRRRLLQYHINAVHTGVRPHECEICGSSFVYPEHKKKHMLIHGNSRPYTCEVCGKEFNSCANRNAHRFVHSTKKPYECLKCSAGFMRKPLLLAHMKHAGHANDTIIINQPHIRDKGKLTLGREISMIDSCDDIIEAPKPFIQELTTSVCNETLQIIPQNPADITNDVTGTDSMQYLRFDDLGKDGDGIIWIDIGRDKENV